MLVHHRALLVAVAATGLLVSLAASSGALVTGAAASSELKDELVDLTPLATGLQISGLGESVRPLSSLVRSADERERTVRALGARLGLERPLFTVETALPLTLSTGTGDVPLNLLARTGVLGHVKILSRTGGPGVYVDNFSARMAGIAPGGRFRLSYADRGGASRVAEMRV